MGNIMWEVNILITAVSGCGEYHSSGVICGPMTAFDLLFSILTKRKLAIVSVHTKGYII